MHDTPKYMIDLHQHRNREAQGMVPTEYDPSVDLCSSPENSTGSIGNMYRARTRSTSTGAGTEQQHARVAAAAGPQGRRRVPGRRVGGRSRSSWTAPPPRHCRRRAVAIGGPPYAGKPTASRMRQSSKNHSSFEPRLPPPPEVPQQGGGEARRDGQHLGDLRACPRPAGRGHRPR